MRKHTPLWGTPAFLHRAKALLPEIALSPSVASGDSQRPPQRHVLLHPAEIDYTNQGIGKGKLSCFRAEGRNWYGGQR